MQSIQFEDNPYLGRTATVPWQRPYDPLACKASARACTAGARASAATPRMGSAW